MSTVATKVIRVFTKYRGSQRHFPYVTLHLPRSDDSRPLCGVHLDPAFWRIEPKVLELVGEHKWPRGVCSNCSCIEAAEVPTS